MFNVIIFPMNPVRNRGRKVTGKVEVGLLIN